MLSILILPNNVNIFSDCILFFYIFWYTVHKTVIKKIQKGAAFLCKDQFLSVTLAYFIFSAYFAAFYPDVLPAAKALRQSRRFILRCASSSRKPPAAIRSALPL